MEKEHGFGVLLSRAEVAKRAHGMGVWECGGMGEKTKMEDSGSKIEEVSIHLAMLDHPSSILKRSPTPPYAHTPIQHDKLKTTLNVTDLCTPQ